MNETVFTASPKTLGLGQDDLSVMMAYMEFVSILNPGFADLFAIGEGKHAEKLGYRGVPVRTMGKNPANGATIETVLTKLDRRPLDDALFALPEGLTKTDLPGLPAPAAGAKAP
jgi:hypothetical protein